MQRGFVFVDAFQKINAPENGDFTTEAQGHGEELMIR
jgi:hypothetical protein